MKTWAWDTVVRMEKYTGKLSIDGIEVIYNPIRKVYEEKVRKAA